MNNVRINELTNLNVNYKSGAAKEILYRCNLVAPFTLDTLKEFPEYNTKEVIKTLDSWFNLCETNNLDLVESLIEFYNFGSINNTPVEFYESYPEVFERIVDFLLGKINWQPNSSDNNAAVNCSNNLTAQLLDYIYFNK